MFGLNKGIASVALLQCTISVPSGWRQILSNFQTNGKHSVMKQEKTGICRKYLRGFFELLIIDKFAMKRQNY